MRMSDTINIETMKVSEATDMVSSPKDNTTKSEVSEQSLTNRDEHSSDNKRDMQPNAKLKLVRSLAVCEESPPSPIPEPPAAPQDGFLLQPFEKEERSAQDQGEKEDSCDKADKPEKTQRKMLSRDSSQDYTDSTGIDLHEFLVNTLKSNPRDRIMLLKLEQDILDFISNNESQKRKFPPMTSYHRMLLHRVAAYFGMDHNVDPSGKSVVINKTTNTRIPDQKFSEHIKDDRADDFQKRYILKRDNSSFDREDSTIRMRLKADKRSKSMEEREEEYQRARDRIFAHEGDHFILDRRAQDEEACMSTQQRRQIFRLRAGRSGASRQSSSETETLPRHGEPRPWSSTDSSDSSNRLAPRPAITKASSFSGISPGLVRGDSMASSKSTGRLSKTGSESCTSVGSSSSSLSRPQLPLPVSVPPQSSIPSTPAAHPANDTRGSGHPETAKSSPAQPLAATAATNIYVLPLEASGIPPGTVLVNPHTGKPFINPDGSTVVYNPSTVAPAAGRSLQQGKTQQPLMPQQPTSHFHSQPDALNSQFSQMTLGRQPPSDSGGPAPDARPCPAPYHHHHHHHHHPSSMVVQGPPPQQLGSYMVAGPSGGHQGVLAGQPVPTPAPAQHPAPTYSNNTPGPAAFPGPTLSQPLLQQHTYIQQPVQQVATCYCSPAHYPHCSGQQQHYRSAVAPLPYNCPQGQNLAQQQVHQTMMPNPAPSYQTIVGVQPTPNLAVAGSHQSNMGNQMQGMMVQYPPMPSYQVSVPQQTYQQPVLVSCQSGQGAVAVAGMQPCYSLLPPNQHTTMSSMVSFLPAPVMEPLQFPQASSPCISQQHPGQQCAGLLPPAPGSGMVMVQMTAPPCQQPRAPSPCQRKQPSHKPPCLEQQRSRRPAEFPAPPDNSQSSRSSSPAPCPSPGHHPSVKGLPVGISPIPIMAHHHHHHHQLPAAFCHSGQGEAHYPLLGQPLQYKPSIRPPLIQTAPMVAKHQGPLGVWRSGHGRKANRKPLPADLSVGEAVSSRILEVTGAPEGIGCSDGQRLLAEVYNGGATIPWPSDHQPRLCSTNREGPGRDAASPYTVLAMFLPGWASHSTLLQNSNPHAAFKLRTSNRHKEELCDSDKAGS
ncbi:R3H domain-containing protein 1-like isoform X2 [Myripristis murdjan]|uniref:R3H domain-containing protein 1-like isoform X2 n=1 Tax=Myripristis murdjan TaxID=586833 RepID=UPI00117640C6|nr:R3H domain-containing protein 1-like isoform X2 [Myripristis murdjan]